MVDGGAGGEGVPDPCQECRLRRLQLQRDGGLPHGQGDGRGPAPRGQKPDPRGPRRCARAHERRRCRGVLRQLFAEKPRRLEVRRSDDHRAQRQVHALGGIMGTRLDMLKMPFLARDGAAPAQAPAKPARAVAKSQGAIGRKVKLLAALLVALLAVDAAIVVYDAQHATFNTLYVAAVGKIRMLSQRLAKAAQQASQGNREAFKQLRESRAELSRLINLLAGGGISAGVELPATPERVRPQLAALEREWHKTERNATLVIREEPNLVALGAAVRAINDHNPALLEIADEV